MSEAKIRALEEMVVLLLGTCIDGPTALSTAENARRWAQHLRGESVDGPMVASSISEPEVLDEMVIIFRKVAGEALARGTGLLGRMGGSA